MAVLLGAVLGYLIGWHRAACGLPIAQQRRPAVPPSPPPGSTAPSPQQRLREFAAKAPELRSRVDEDLKVVRPELSPTDREQATDEIMGRLRDLHVGVR